MAQATAFICGFETGDASEINSLLAGDNIQSTIVRSGGYAYQGAISSNLSIIASGLNGSGGFAYRQHMYFTGVLGGNTLINERAPGTTSRLTLRDDGANPPHLQIMDGASTLGLTTVTGTTPLTFNIWHCIEVCFDPTAGGIVKVYLDGVLEISTTHTNDVSATNTNQFRVSGNVTNPFYVDDIRIDFGGFAPKGPGRCIARQGINSKATTPTYTAWTKTGLTTSGECWSDTPFSGTNNCNKATTASAQTMVVDKFSVDPSRAVEGVSAISSGATINAVKVCAIAKISSTTSQAQSLRRRVSSADTDTAVTLTTSDAFYSTAIFTDTAANLDAYEIGAVTGATGAGTRTVEDMWMMVDYTPVANTLAAGVGAFVLTGKALTLPVGRNAALASGAFALTGQSLTFGNGHAFSLGAGSFALSGQALKLLVDHAFKTGVGAFTLSGEPITGVRSVLAHLDAGAFIVTGEATSLLNALSFSLDVGPFVFIGRGIAIAKNSVPFNLGSGAYLVSSVNGAGKTLWRISKFYPSVTLPPVAPKGRLEEVRVSQPSLDNWRNGG